MSEPLPKTKQHLGGRCGTCNLWEDMEMGSGKCTLPDKPKAPIRTSDPAAIYTRIDFGCRWFESPPVPPEEPKPAEYTNYRR